MIIDHFSIAIYYFKDSNRFRSYTIIGHTTANKGAYRLIGKSGAAFEMKAQGWQHFKG
jgi:hypothetical protein